MSVWGRPVGGLIVVALLVASGTFASAAADDARAGQTEISCPISRGPVTLDVLLRVFPIRIGTTSGTAFTLGIENRQYIVTAKHVLEGELPAMVEIELDHWTNVSVTLVGQGRGQDDVLVLATDGQLSVTFPVNLGTRNLILGQSVRFLGYFPRVRTSPLPGYKKRGTPLVMSGIVSGCDFREGGGEGRTII